MLVIKDFRLQQRSAISTVMVIVSLVLLPLKDSSGIKVNGQHHHNQQDHTDSRAQIQYPSSTQTSKGNMKSISGFIYYYITTYKWYSVEVP